MEILIAKGGFTALFLGAFTMLLGLFTCFEPEPAKAKVNTKANAYEEQYASLVINTNRSELFRGMV
jgi:hypothetical protein